jgi:hypothetical protein
MLQNLEVCGAEVNGNAHEEARTRKITVNRPIGKKKGFRLEPRKPFTLNLLKWLRGLQCTEAASLILPFRYSLTDGMA